MNLRQLWPAAVVVVVFAWSCRDGVPPFTPPELEYGERITFGLGEDRDPRWTVNGDSLIYHTNDYGALPGNGVLLKISARGGTAVPLMEDIQRALNRMLAVPVPSPDGRNVAYLDLIRVDQAVSCIDSANMPPNADCTNTQPLLDSAALRVRRLDAQQPPLADPAVGIKLAGTDPLYRTAGSDTYVMQALPFQQQYRRLRAVLLRPSWAPDNQRIVFSNGSQLFMWRVGEASAVPLAGTEDAVSPAWQPTADVIAFTQLVRGDSAEIRCTCVQPGSSGPVPALSLHRRMTYTVSSARIVLMSVDGRSRVDIGEGQDPAWSPDGRSLYVVRNDQIVRIDPASAGAAATPIPNTQGGRYPAVSPDGKRLAFARPQLRNDYDIWVIDLPQ